VCLCVVFFPREEGEERMVEMENMEMATAELFLASRRLGLKIWGWSVHVHVHPHTAKQICAPPGGT